MSHSIPQAAFALISGSAGWGIRFPEDLGEPGIRALDRGLSFDTPWGAIDNWQVLEVDGSVTVDGKSRTVLNIFSHGWPTGRIDHAVSQRVFWVLQQAGVRKVLADSTCGSLNRAVQPRDFVIASDMIDLGQTPYSTLPGRFTYLCRGAQMFCPSLGQALEEQARALWPQGGRVYGLANRLIVAHTWGPRFETPAEARTLQLFGADFVNQSMAPEATGAREIGACFISASYVVNYVDGIIPEEWGELDTIHADLGAVAARVSLRTIARAELTDTCGCHAYRAQRPAKYAVVAQAGNSGAA